MGLIKYCAFSWIMRPIKSSGAFTPLTIQWAHIHRPTDIQTYRQTDVLRILSSKHSQNSNQKKKIYDFGWTKKTNARRISGTFTSNRSSSSSSSSISEWLSRTQSTHVTCRSFVAREPIVFRQFPTAEPRRKRGRRRRRCPVVAVRSL